MISTVCDSPSTPVGRLDEIASRGRHPNQTLANAGGAVQVLVVALRFEVQAQHGQPRLGGHAGGTKAEFLPTIGGGKPVRTDAPQLAAVLVQERDREPRPIVPQALGPDGRFHNVAQQGIDLNGRAVGRGPAAVKLDAEAGIAARRRLLADLDADVLRIAPSAAPRPACRPAVVMIVPLAVEGAVKDLGRLGIAASHRHIGPHGNQQQRQQQVHGRKGLGIGD